MAEEQFWMVSGAGPATHRHPSREAAETEAKRLARISPGQIFVVMEAVSAHVKIDVRSWSMRPSDPCDYDDNIPF